MDDDVVDVNFNLILHLQQQLQMRTDVVEITIVTIIAYGLNMLRIRDFY